MREKTCGVVLLLSFVLGLCALAYGSAPTKECGSTDAVFCGRVASR